MLDRNEKVKVYGADWGLSRPHNASSIHDLEANTLRPLHGNTEFDFEAVFAALDGAQEFDEEKIKALVERMAQKVVVAKFEEFFDWMVATIRSGGELRERNLRGVRTVGTKTLAAAWVLNPQRFEGASASTVSHSFGLARPIFSEAAADFSKKFGVKNKFQDHGTKRHDDATKN